MAGPSRTPKIEPNTENRPPTSFPSGRGGRIALAPRERAMSILQQSDIAIDRIMRHDSEDEGVYLAFQMRMPSSRRPESVRVYDRVRKQPNVDCSCNKSNVNACTHIFVSVELNY